MKKNNYLRATSLTLVLTMVLSYSFAQQYDRSAGIRLGGTSGLTFKKFIIKEQAIEVILSNRSKGIQLTGLVLFHRPMEFSFEERFFFYYGIGTHLGVSSHDDIKKIEDTNSTVGYRYITRDFVEMGLDVLAGVEFRMLSIPITLSLDMKPYVNFIGFRKLKTNFSDISFALKYIF